MRLCCKQSELKRAISIVKLAIDSETSVPSFSDILLLTNENSLEIRGYSSGVTTIVKINAEVEKQGEFSVKTNILLVIVNYLVEQEVYFSTITNDNLEICCGSYIGNIKRCYDTRQFPNLSDIKRNNIFITQFKEFRNMVREGIYELNSSRISSDILTTCFNMNFENGKLMMIGTDRLRTSKIYCNVNAKTKANAIIEGKVINRIIRILDKGENDKNITIIIDENHLLFILGNISIYATPFNKKRYFSIDRVFDNPCSSTATIKRKSLLYSIERATAIFNNIGKYIINLEFNESSLDIISSSDFGNSKDKESIKLEGKTVKVRLMGEFLIQALNSLDEDEIIIKILENKSAYIIRNKEKDNYTYYIALMRDIG